MKRERLFARIPTPCVSKHGIGADDILRVPACPELIADLLDCLGSDDELDLVFALMFAEHLGTRPDFYGLAQPSLPALTAAIRSALAQPSMRVRACAIRAFVAYRSCFDDYSVAMRLYLCSTDPQIRGEALIAAPTFLPAKDLAALLPFREDLGVSETVGMGGPLRYLTRDLALAIAERIAGKQFSAGDCFEERDGSRVSWRSWSAFTHWLESKKKWRFFGVC